MANDAGLTRIHPGIFSTINADQTTYDTANGVLTLFAADIFEKGPDGKIGFVSTKDEFIFKYGLPNYSKYGQSAYNILKWLEAGGQAYVMRVLPDDATYAHALLNVQTKVRKNEKVVEVDGKKVKIDDVFIRPTTTLVKKNNLNEEMLNAELLQDRIEEATVDGYTNNFILLTIPHGRGESYNNLGFRLTPNDSFSDTQQSVVYNFEVLRFESEQVASLVEGPFYVTFDPDSLSDTEDSMFIEDVVNRQSKYLKVKVNLENFAKVARTINPDVKPTVIDIFKGGYDHTGRPKVYNKTTNRLEDVHLTLHRYNSAGLPVAVDGKPLLNIPDATDPVQAALVNLDNGLRENEYLTFNSRLHYMKGMFPKLRSEDFNEFTNGLDHLVTLDGGKQNITGGLLKDIVTKNFENTQQTEPYYQYEQAKEAYNGEQSEENLNVLVSRINDLSEIIRSTFLDNTTKVSAAYKLVEQANSSNAGILVKYLSNLQKLQNHLNEKDLVNIFTTKHKSVIFEIERSITSYELGTSSASASEGMVLVLNAVESEIKYISESLLPVAYGTEDVPEDIAKEFRTTEAKGVVSTYNESLSLLTDIQRGIVPDNAQNRSTIFKAAKGITSKLIDIIDKVTVASSTKNIEKAVTVCKSTIMADMKEFASAVKTMLQVTGSYTREDILENARRNIELEVADIQKIGSKFFNTSIIDFDSVVKLLLGSDGSFTYSSLADNRTRSEAVRKQIIKAYNGTLNSDILNKDLYQFDVVLDAKYHNDVKKAIAELARSMRQDFLFFANDAGPEYTVSPEDSLEWRKNKFNISSEYTVIHAQDLTYYDEYTGKDIRFTPSYVLAGKLPKQAVQFGLHYPMAGVNRGLVDGFKAISWTPNEAYREKLYRNKINYIQRDSKFTRFNSQLTTINSTGPVSYVNNMFTLLAIKRGAEELLVNYQFEFNGATCFA